MGLYIGYVGIQIDSTGTVIGGFRDIIPKYQTQMGQRMENEMETCRKACAGLVTSFGGPYIWWGDIILGPKNLPYSACSEYKIIKDPKL